VKKTLLLLTLGIFLTGGLAYGPGAEAAPTSHKAHKAHKASHKARTKTKHKRTSRHARAHHHHHHHKVAVEPRSNSPLEKVSFERPTQGGDLALRSAAALVVDQKTGEALYSKNINVPTPIASITKLMTAMVTLDAKLPMDEEITIGWEDVDRLKGSSSRLPLGTRLTREELLHLALIASENRAAAALSRAYPGGRAAFVTAMNRKAQEIGMKDAHFVDGTGLNSENRATAADLVKMVDAAYRYPLIREITSTGAYDVTLPAKRTVRIRHAGRVHRVTREVTRNVAFHNTNALTRSDDWDIGISKTGYINEAGRCLVMQAKIGDQPIIIVLLDSWGKWSRIGDANRIKKWLEQGAEKPGPA
jgi:D-alanyl-D-alanine endopeptidase (penicillin-binding protein 7)